MPARHVGRPTLLTADEEAWLPQWIGFCCALGILPRRGLVLRKAPNSQGPNPPTISDSELLPARLFDSNDWPALEGFVEQQRAREQLTRLLAPCLGPANAPRSSRKSWAYQGLTRRAGPAEAGPRTRQQSESPKRCGC